MSTESVETQLLRAWAGGDQGALDQLTPHVYQELRRIPGRFMQNEREDQSIQATALVHEAYLKLIDVHNVDWQHRAHFFAVAAQIMRRILLDRARSRVAAKRGGNVARINLDEVPDVSTERAGELIALDDALSALAGIDPRKARVVELRFFGGLTVEETAAIQGVSGHRYARLEHGPRLAPVGIERRKLRKTFRGCQFFRAFYACRVTAVSM
jgi:RNA polymerase sigma factor (TIGR02999 family)